MAEENTSLTINDILTIAQNWIVSKADNCKSGWTANGFAPSKQVIAYYPNIGSGSKSNASITFQRTGNAYIDPVGEWQIKTDLINFMKGKGYSENSFGTKKLSTSEVATIFSYIGSFVASKVVRVTVDNKTLYNNTNNSTGSGSINTRIIYNPNQPVVGIATIYSDTPQIPTRPTIDSFYTNLQNILKHSIKMQQVEYSISTNSTSSCSSSSCSSSCSLFIAHIQ